MNAVLRHHARLLRRLVFAGFSPERGGGARAPDVSDNALFKVQTMPDTRRTADASVPRHSHPWTKRPGAWNYGDRSLEVLSNLPDALPLCIHSDAAFLPGQPGDHPSPSRKARAIVGQATGEGDEKDQRILRRMTIALKRHASFFFTKSCARISSPFADAGSAPPA
jgi:hypothetical protein